MTTILSDGRQLRKLVTPALYIYASSPLANLFCILVVCFGKDPPNEFKETYLYSFTKAYIGIKTT